MVDIRGNYKIIFVLYKLEKPFICAVVNVHIAVDIDIPRPVRPEFHRRFKREKAAGIHIPKAVFLRKIAEIFFKSFVAVGKSRRRGKSRACAYYYRFGGVDLSFKTVYLRRVIACKVRSPFLRKH